MNCIVVHYKELALKGGNRPWFINTLVRNLKTALAGLHVRSFKSIMGRIEIEMGSETPWDEVRQRLRHRYAAPARELVELLGPEFEDWISDEP